MLPDLRKPFVLYCDASNVAAASVLLQDQGQGLQPVAYYSKKFTDTEHRYPTYEKELYSLILALKEFRCFIEGSADSVVYTDHKSLAELMKQPKLNGRQGRWLELIWGYQHNIKWKEGVANLADPFTRRADYVEAAAAEQAAAAAAGVPHPLFLQLTSLEASVTTALGDLKELLLTGYQEDAFYAPNNKRLKALQCRQGLWFYRKRVAIPRNMELRKQLLAEAHESVYAGHQGWHRTLEVLRGR